MSQENRSTAKNTLIFFLITCIGYLLYSIHAGKYKDVKTAVDVAKVTKSEQVTAGIVKETNNKRDTILKLLRGKIQHDSVFKVVTLAGPVQEAAQYKALYEGEVAQNHVLLDSLTVTRQSAKVYSQVAYTYKNKYLHFHYQPSTDTMIQFISDYHYDAEISARQSIRGKWLMGAKKSYIDLFTTDTNTTINGFRTYEFEQKAPLFGLRIQAITTYGLLSRKIQGGFGGTFNFGRFTVLNSYLYDLDFLNEKNPGRKFNIVLSTKYDIGRF